MHHSNRIYLRYVWRGIIISDEVNQVEKARGHADTSRTLCHSPHVNNVNFLLEDLTKRKIPIVDTKRERTTVFIPDVQFLIPVFFVSFLIIFVGHESFLWGH